MGICTVVSISYFIRGRTSLKQKAKHIVLYIKRVIVGLSSDMPPEDYFELLNTESLVGFSLYCVQTLLGDAMLVSP
jgi:hypothetical protein